MRRFTDALSQPCDRLGIMLGAVVLLWSFSPAIGQDDATSADRSARKSLMSPPPKPPRNGGQGQRRFPGGERFQGGERAQRGEFGRNRQFQPRRPPNQPRSFESEPIDDAWVFVDGEYLQPPYTVVYNADGLTINGRKIDFAAAPAEEPVNDDEEFAMGARRRPNRRRPLNDLMGFVDGGKEFLFAWSGQPLILLEDTRGGIELMKLMLAEQPDPQLVEAFLGEIPAEQQETASQWLAEFRPTAELKARAKESVEHLAEVEAENNREIHARHLLDELSYPLSVVAMVLCAFALGHLLRHQPRDDSTMPATPEMRGLVYRSLALAAAFSALDLVWTLLALSAGAMRETNPIGASLTDNPMMLASFKIVLTLFAITIIGKLWQHRAAQLAAWWSCLILMLLTVRWLAFDSMLA